MLKALLFFAVLSALPATLLASPLSYTIKHHPSGPALHIELEFEGDESGTTLLNLPFEWAGQTGFHKGIGKFKVHTAGVSQKQLNDSEIELSHAPSQRIALSYEVSRAWKGDVDYHGFYWPILRQDYLHFFGYGAFVYPDGKFNRRRPVSINWQNFPEKWAFANSHGVNNRNQSVEISIGELLHSVYVAGDFRVHETRVNGQPVHLAVRGDWAISDSTLLDLTSKVFQSQRDFWNDHAYPSYLVTLIPTEEECCSQGGTGLTRSFAMNSSYGDAEWLVPGLKHLLSHELFHNWNGRKIKRTQPEQLQYWFSEGFTEYYSWILNLRSGLITLPDLVGALNKGIRQYMLSPVRNAPNSRIASDFWKDDQVAKLPYLRGTLIAMRWNSLIKKRSPGHSLDHFMKDFLQAALRDGALVSQETVECLLRPYLKEGVQSDLKALVDQGDTVEIAEDGAGPCASLVTREVTVGGKTVVVPQFELNVERFKHDPAGCVAAI